MQGERARGKLVSILQTQKDRWVTREGEEGRGREVKKGEREVSSESWPSLFGEVLE